MAFWPHIISMPLYFALLWFIIHIFRKHYKASLYFWIATLFTFPLWMMGGVEGWFRWVKILSVIIPTIIIAIARVSVIEERKGKFWKFFQNDKFLWFPYGILFLNILEATIKDAQLGNYFNSATGFLLCVTIPFAPKFWSITKTHYGDLVGFTTASWNFLYTTWNACFVFAESPVYFGSSLCILLVAEIYPIVKKRPELYITARMFTLAAHLLLRACYDVFPQVMNTSSWYDPQVLKVWGIINFVLIVPYTFWHMWQLHTMNAENSFRRIKPAL
ncbi:hypothetical protein LC087_02350 [Bacillus carboniphilus]|uniref:Uncharacterized protein n=1 Tax=Bacillus carboniphilus TaxID=86663 RepID=A0ABY9JUJ8_9BACI|nr:hypothetical protein [Bacillus carboniphilus]WLR43076.1 hypothetical protein LC087_02350 [Bacillus carboniphilus]